MLTEERWYLCGTKAAIVAASLLPQSTPGQPLPATLQFVRRSIHDFFIGNETSGDPLSVNVLVNDQCAWSATSSFGGYINWSSGDEKRGVVITQEQVLSIAINRDFVSAGGEIHLRCVDTLNDGSEFEIAEMHLFAPQGHISTETLPISMDDYKRIAHYLPQAEAEKMRRLRRDGSSSKFW